MAVALFGSPKASKSTNHREYKYVQAMATPTDPDMPAASLLLSHAPDTGILSCPPRFLSPCHGSSCNVMSQVPGAHNDVRAEGKGRSVQRPRKRLKFENVLTVVLLLFLVRTSIVSLTDDSASKAAKIVVRHKIVSVRAEGYVSQQSSTPESQRESIFHEWKCPRGLLALAVK